MLCTPSLSCVMSSPMYVPLLHEPPSLPWIQALTVPHLDHIKNIPSSQCVQSVPLASLNAAACQGDLTTENCSFNSLGHFYMVLNLLHSAGLNASPRVQMLLPILSPSPATSSPPAQKQLFKLWQNRHSIKFTSWAPFSMSSCSLLQTSQACDLT